MRGTLKMALGSMLVLAFTSLALPGEDEARSLVADAIKAMGGKENLAKQTSVTWKEKGTYYGMGAGLPYTGVYSMKRPGQFRMEIEGVFTLVLNNDKGWVKSMGETKDLDADQMAMHLRNQKAGVIESLLPLTDKAFTLTMLPEAKVGDRPARSVKVTRKDYPDVSLYFDKKTLLLVKSEYRTKSAEAGFKEVAAETVYMDHRDIDGAKVPTRWVMKQDGKLFVEAEIQDWRAGAKLDAAAFGRP